MVNDSDSFVLDAADKIYVYDGPSASPLGSFLTTRATFWHASLHGEGLSRSKLLTDMRSISRV